MSVMCIFPEFVIIFLVFGGKIGSVIEHQQISDIIWTLEFKVVHKFLLLLAD